MEFVLLRREKNGLNSTYSELPKSDFQLWKWKAQDRCISLELLHIWSLESQLLSSETLDSFRISWISWFELYRGKKNNIFLFTISQRVFVVQRSFKFQDMHKHLKFFPRNFSKLSNSILQIKTHKRDFWMFKKTQNPGPDPENREILKNICRTASKML